MSDGRQRYVNLEITLGILSLCMDTEFHISGQQCGMQNKLLNVAKLWFQWYII